MAGPDAAPQPGSQVILLKFLRTNWTSKNNKATFLNLKMLQMIVKPHFCIIVHSNKYFSVWYVQTFVLLFAVKMFLKQCNHFQTL